MRGFVIIIWYIIYVKILQWISVLTPCRLCQRYWRARPNHRTFQARSGEDAQCSTCRWRPADGTLDGNLPFQVPQQRLCLELHLSLVTTKYLTSIYADRPVKNGKCQSIGFYATYSKWKCVNNYWLNWLKPEFYYFNPLTPEPHNSQSLNLVSE